MHPAEERTRKEYSDALFAYLGKADVQKAYINPVIDRLVKKNARATVDYETAFRALKRACKGMADRWKLETTMSTGLSKAARDTIIENVTRTVMEIYFIRRKEASGQAIPQRP